MKKTQELIEDSRDLGDLIKKRDVSLDTVIKHLDLIKKNNQYFLLEKFKPENNILDMVSEAVEDILNEKKKKDFLDNGDIKKGLFLMHLMEKFLMMI